MERYKYMSIRSLAKTGILSEHYLRLLEAQGRLPGVYSGKKKLVNVEQLLEQLDRDSRITEDLPHAE